MSETADRSLRLVLAELAFLPEMAAGWADEPAGNRLNYSLEWDDLIGRILLLQRAYQAEELSPAQQDRYREMVAKLRELLPLIGQLDLARPPQDVLAVVA